MRVLVASSNRGVNGAAVYARRILWQLRAAGHDAALACEEDSWVGRDLPADVPVLRTDFTRWPFDEGDRAAAWCRRHGIELIHSHLTRSGNFAAILRQRHGIRSVAHLHANHPQLHTGFHDLLIAVSADVARRHRLLPWNWMTEVVTLPNFVDAADFSPASAGEPDPLRDALGVAAGTPVVAVVGLISRRKGQDLAVRAFAELRRARPDAVLAVIGGGELPSGLPLEGVRLLGHREDVALLLPHASVVVVPSREEPFGLAAIEAMACEVPVVAFAVGGLAEVIGGGAGVAVPSGDCGAMAAATRALLSDEAARRGQARAGRASALARYGKEAHLAALVAHFRRVLAQ
ncbi:MAG: Capsular glucan synthase [Verrucomicrobiota bacterium]|jgi:glycosyltransferase involved in cell wall biosynthesis